MSDQDIEAIRQLYSKLGLSVGESNYGVYSKNNINRITRTVEKLFSRIDKLSSWTSTTDRLPEESGEFLCYFDTLGCVATSVEWYSAKEKTFLPIEDNGKVLNTPTHWMPLPKAPLK